MKWLISKRPLLPGTCNSERILTGEKIGCNLIGFLAKNEEKNELSGLLFYCHLNGEIISGIISVSVN